MDRLKVYVDSSVILRKILGAPRVFRQWGKWEVALTSELTRVEALRTLDRLRILGEITSVQLAGCVEELGLWLSAFEIAPLDAQVLRRASGPFPTPIGTLDAMHLATALLWTESKAAELSFLTHDRQLSVAARASGVPVRFTA
jgi:predicted nucleic acid-binding protein